MATPITSRARRRTRLDPDRRREELIDAASELFESRPYDRLSTEEIARWCGVSEGLIYHYFGGKRGLYTASLERTLADFLGAIEDPGPPLPLDQRLRHSIDSYLDFVEQYPRSYAAVLRGGIGMDDEVHALIEGAREGFCAMIARGLGIEKPSPSFVVAIWGWMGFVENSCARWVALREIPRVELRDLLVHMALATFGRVLAPAA
jgi:AcrR family transcriptional regulator